MGQKLASFAGHKAFIADQASLYADIEQRPWCARGEIDGAVSIVTGNDLGAFNLGRVFWR
jgi:hypothetical protein